MSMIDAVRAEMVTAMKNKEKERKESLSMLLSALKNKAIDKRADLTEEEEYAVVKKEMKQTQETMDLAPADRTDIIEPVSYTHLDVYKRQDASKGASVHLFRKKAVRKESRDKPFCGGTAGIAVPFLVKAGGRPAAGDGKRRKENPLDRRSASLKIR